MVMSSSVARSGKSSARSSARARSSRGLAVVLGQAIVHPAELLVQGPQAHRAGQEVGRHHAQRHDLAVGVVGFTPAQPDEPFEPAADRDRGDDARAHAPFVHARHHRRHVDHPLGVADDHGLVPGEVREQSRGDVDGRGAIGQRPRCAVDRPVVREHELAGGAIERHPRGAGGAADEAHRGQDVVGELVDPIHRRARARASNRRVAWAASRTRRAWVASCNVVTTRATPPTGSGWTAQSRRIQRTGGRPVVHARQQAHHRLSRAPHGGRRHVQVSGGVPAMAGEQPPAHRPGRLAGQLLAGEAEQVEGTHRRRHQATLTVVGHHAAGQIRRAGPGEIRTAGGGGDRRHRRRFGSPGGAPSAAPLVTAIPLPSSPGRPQRRPVGGTHGPCQNGGP